MFCELFSSFARIHARFMKDSGRPRYMLANEVLMRVHGVLCSPYEFYARHPDFMLAIQILCSPYEIYARHLGFMLAIRDLCSPLFLTKQKTLQEPLCNVLTIHLMKLMPLKD